MCGIFAAFHLSEELSLEQLKAGILSASHRGPDNTGTFSDTHCFLGHSRLAIVGLEKESNQPFQFQELVLSFNGEIFNYIELRNELLSMGYEFYTNSDTEVVVKAFHCWGAECFTRFNGMWALVIYDREKRRLVASRDRFGQKPLFIMKREGIFLLSSEIQQLLPFTDSEIDYQLIQMFLKEGTYDAAGRTFFRNIEEFPKAHYCEFYGSGEPISTRFWDYWNGSIRPVNDALFEEFSVLFEDAVKIRLRTDVPFGILISGGIDSTMIAACSRQILGNVLPIPAFTYASHDEEDESCFAQRVADKLELDLEIRWQEDNADDYISRLRQLVRHLGRGHSSPAIVSIDYLYGAVHESGIKVALDGQGADELLAGYRTYFPIAILGFLRRGHLKQAWYVAVDMWRSGFWLSLMLFLRNVMPPFGKRIGRWFYGYEKLFREYHLEKRTYGIVSKQQRMRNPIALNRYLIRHHDVGLSNLLYYGDIVAMKNSVENRSPFMDHRLVELAFSTCEKLKVWNGINKYALKVLPYYKQFKAELDRKKIGFSSNIKMETKQRMIKELQGSPILQWPIFSRKMKEFVDGPRIKTAKFERLMFRLYQVHLWNDIIQRENWHIPVGGSAINNDVPKMPRASQFN